jgi:acetate kinase
MIEQQSEDASREDRDPTSSLHYRQVFFVKKMFSKLSQHHKKANASFLSIVVESFLHLQNCKQFDVMFYQTMKKVVLSGVSECWKQ